jgi:hypothetical protein
MTAVAAYLRDRIDNHGAGCRSFGLDREVLPKELSGSVELAALLAVVERTVTDPTLIPDVNWSPELLEWWRDRLGRMAAALRAIAQDTEAGAAADGEENVHGTDLSGRDNQ